MAGDALVLGDVDPEGTAYGVGAAILTDGHRGWQVIALVVQASPVDHWFREATM